MQSRREVNRRIRRRPYRGTIIKMRKNKSVIKFEKNLGWRVYIEITINHTGEPTDFGRNRLDVWDQDKLEEIMTPKYLNDETNWIGEELRVTVGREETNWDDFLVMIIYLLLFVLIERKCDEIQSEIKLRSFWMEIIQEEEITGWK